MLRFIPIADLKLIEQCYFAAKIFTNSFLVNQMLEAIVDKISMAATNIIRLGPAGLIGTVALFNVVNAGVFSCSFAFMTSNWVREAV